MNFTHPLCISVGQVVIDCNNVNTLALKCIQIGRQCRYQCLTFTSLHLSDTTLMQDHTADQLNSVMAHAKYTGCCLSDNCISFHKEIIQCLSFRQTLLKLICLRSQFFIRQLLHSRTHGFNFINDWIYSLQFSLTVCTHNLAENSHIVLS